MTKNAYDEKLYPYSIKAFTHPARMGVVARLFGHGAAPFEKCRVLEVGGGDGVNVVSMALAAPDSEFVNFDLAESAIEQGRRLVERTGVRNVAQLAMNLMDVPASLGEFDYIIAHGVYAWTPQPVREGLMALFARHLSPAGIAMVSYNALPGCHIRRAVRDLAHQAARGHTEPEARIGAARAALEFHVARWDRANAAQNALLEEAKGILAKPDGVLFHDELCDDWNPQFVSDVARAARGQGLDYLGDMQRNLLGDALFPGQLHRETTHLTGGDFAAYEQIRDFADARPFRETLLCRAGAPLERRFDPARAKGLWIDGIFERVDTPGKAHSFRAAGGGEISTSDAGLADSLDRISKAWPAAVPLSDVAGDADTLEAMTRLFTGGAAGFSTSPFAAARVPGERPLAGKLARVQAAAGAMEVTTLRHTPARIESDGLRAVLPLLDGTRTLEQAAAELAPAQGGDAASLRNARAALSVFVHTGLMEA